MNTVPILPCPGGMDNVHSDGHAVFQPRPTQGGMQPPERMRAIVDLDVNSDGTLATRPEPQMVRAVTDGRRLFAKGGMALSQVGSTLALENLTAGTSRALAIGLGPLVAHEWPAGGDRAFLSDGNENILVRSGVASVWGLPVLPDSTVTRIAGALPAASYLIAATVRTGPLHDFAAEEGGARAPLRYTLTATGGLRLAVLVPTGTGSHVAFYISRPDQPEPFLVSVVEAVFGVASLDVTTEDQLRWSDIPVVTQGWGPPPSGITAIGSMQSYMLVAVGRALYRSWSGLPGLFLLSKAVQMFPSPITAIVGVQDGAWIGTERGLYWLSGGDPALWGRQRVTEHPVIPDGALVDGGLLLKLQVEAPVALFVTTHGIVAGLPGGSVRRLTQDVYHFPEAARVSIAYCETAPRRFLVAVT